MATQKTLVGQRAMAARRKSVPAQIALMVCIGLAGVTAAWSQTPNPDPRGLYVYSWDIPFESSPTTPDALSAKGASGLTTAMATPGIDGITIVVGWNELEPEYNVHQWEPKSWVKGNTYLTGDIVQVGSTYYISQIDGNVDDPTGPNVQQCSGAYGNCPWRQTGSKSAILLDEWIVAAINAGKKITLAVSAGQDTPCWLFGSGCGGNYANYPSTPATPLQFEVSAHQGGGVGGCQQVTVAAPWDPTFEGEWGELLQSLSAHLKQTPSPNPTYSLYDFINVVRVSGMNRTTDETRIPAEILQTPCVTNSVQTWLDAGYRPSLLLSGWSSVMQSIKQNFGDKYVNIALIATDGGSSAASGNGQFPFPMIDHYGCVYKKVLPSYATWTPPGPCFDDGKIPDQNLPLMTLAAQMFPGQVVAEVENLDFGFYNGQPEPAQVHPNVVRYAQHLGAIPAFQTNDYLAPFPVRNGGAACWPFTTIAAEEGANPPVPPGIPNGGAGGRCFPSNSFDGLPTPGSWYGQLLQAGITAATTANAAWGTKADPNLKSQMVEIFFPDINGSQCTMASKQPVPTNHNEFVGLVLSGPAPGCGYLDDIAQAHASLVDPPVVAMNFPVAPAPYWINKLPVVGSAQGISYSGKSISKLDCEGAATGSGAGVVNLTVNQEGGPAVVTCTATDSAHKKGQSARALWIDTKPPVTTAEVSAIVLLPFVTLNATDNLSGVKATWYRVNGGSWTEGNSINIGKRQKFVIDYYSVDVAGNVEAVKTITVMGFKAP